jgi:hypothetical protein
MTTLLNYAASYATTWAALAQTVFYAASTAVIVAKAWRREP